MNRNGSAPRPVASPVSVAASRATNIRRAYSRRLFLVRVAPSVESAAPAFHVATRRSTMSVTVYLALGANLGDRAAAIADAVTRLQAGGLLREVTLSPLYETDAVAD